MVEEITLPAWAAIAPTDDRHLRKHRVHEMSRGLGHAPRVAGRADAPALAGEGPYG
jgi:hypothetical protein